MNKQAGQADSSHPPNALKVQTILATKPGWVGSFVYPSALLLMAILAAMIWATASQPVRFVDFTVNPKDGARARAVAVVPKLPKPLPVVVYLHGSGDSLERSTGTLRQFAELGSAAVCMDYTQTNAASFPAQFEALLSWVAAQAWADTNRVVWVGFSLGAQRMLSYLCVHPEAAPPFLIRLAGGRVQELETEPRRLHGKVWIVHGEKDDVFRVTDAEVVARKLTDAGMSVETTVLPGQNHSFGENRQLVFRLLAERCAEEFKARRRGAVAP